MQALFHLRDAHMSDQLDARVDTRAWYVVQCKPLKENYAAQLLRGDLALDIYMPLLVGPAGRGKRQAPLFPGYLFLRADPIEAKLSSINTTPGVVRLLESGGAPQAVPAPVVHAIRERVNTLNNKGGLSNHDFQPGDAVSLKSGPLRGLNAVFVGPLGPSARVRVLLHFLGRLNEVQVDVEVLQRGKVVTSANVFANPQVDVRKDWPKRTTRGKGRTINR